MLRFLRETGPIGDYIYRIMQLWRLRSLMIYHLQTGDQKTQGCDFVWVLKPENQEHWSQEKMAVSAQVIKQDGASSSVLHLGYIQVLSGLSDPHPHWRGHQFKCKSLPETPSQTYLEIMFNLCTPWPGKLTYKINWHSYWSSNMQLSGHGDDIWAVSQSWPFPFYEVLSNLQVQPCCVRYPQPCLFISQSSAACQAGWSSFSFPGT